MKDSEHADELVFHWQQAQDNGQRITPEELCRERPELLPEVKKAIEGLQFLESMMADVQEALDPNGPRQTMANEQSSLNDNTLERSDVPTQIGRYRVLEVLARGGMGVVCRVHDPDFDRTLAVKLILTEARREPGAEQRFLAEAQITGQLQHPSIPPVHEMGHLDDGRPFFAMKLIEGQTLSTLLSERKDPSQDLLRYVSVFEQICQTVGYVHSKGVIHRDLKPLNVMVGAFGEVQVMDWGLAKKLPPTDDARPDHHRTEPERVIDPPTGENGVLEDPDRTKPRPVTGESSWTRDGSVMGTPGYMPPEQARGEIDQLDERCDVFALGAILCEILTGHPAFTGSSHPERLRPAVKDDLSDSFARLEESPADQQLKDLCKWCLAPNKCHRPNAALEVAEAVTKYQEQIQEKLRETELQKREAQIKTIEERKRRRVQMALGLVVCSLLLMVSGSGFLYQRTQAELEASKAEKRRLEDIDQVQKYYALLNAIRKRAKVRQPGWTIPNLADINKAKKLAKDENNLIDLTTEAATSLGALDLLPGRMVIEDFQAGGIAFHPNGKMLAVAHLPTGWFGRYYCTVVVIDLTSNKKPLELKYTGAACWGKPDGAVSLVFRPDGNQIAVGTRHGNVHVWNLGQPNVPPVSWKASNSGSAIEYLTYSADGKSIYTCAGNHQTRRDVPVRRWDLTHNPPKSPAQFANPSTGIAKIRLSPDGKQLCCGVFTHVVGLDPLTLKVTSRPVDRHGAAFAFHRNGNLAVREQNNRLLLVDRLSNTLVRTLIDPMLGLAHEQSHRRFLDIHPSGAFLVSANLHGPERMIKIWEIASGRLLLRKQIGQNVLHRVALSLDGQWLATAADNEVRLHKFSGLGVQQFRGMDSDLLESMFVSADGKTLVTRTGNYFTAWDTLTKENPGRPVGLGFDRPSPKPLVRKGYSNRWEGADAIHPKSTAVVIGRDHTDISVFGLNGKDQRQVLRAFHIQALDFTQDGKKLWGAFTDKILEKRMGAIGRWSWPERQRKEVWHNVTVDGRSELYCLDAGQEYVLVGGRNGYFHVLSENDEKPLLSLAGPGSVVECVALHPAETFGVLGTRGGDVRLVRIPGGQTLSDLPKHDDAVTSMAFSNNGGRFVTSSRDGTVRLYEVSKKKLVHRYNLTLPGAVKQVAFGAEGKLLYVLVNREIGVRVWNLHKLGREMAKLGLD